jgi:hypothetical protein
LENLQIGLYGWHRTDLVGQFYPEDLPSDWQLDYYSNAFRVVLVPQLEWITWDEDDLETIIEAVEAPFYFYFAVEDGLTAEDLSQLTRVVGALKAQACGVVVWSEKPFKKPEIVGLPVTLISTQYKLPGWSWQNQSLWMSGEPLAYLPGLTANAKEQVVLLKAFMQSLTESKLVKKGLAAPFIVGGDAIDMEQVTNLKVIGEFLGY